MEVEQRPAAVGHRGRPGGAAGAVPRGVHGAGIPDDLRSGYGYPQLTHADTKRILGGNVARTMGVDVPIAPAAETAATDPVPLEGGVG